MEHPVKTKFGIPQQELQSEPGEGADVRQLLPHLLPAREDIPGKNCIKIGLPRKLILSKRTGLWEVLFS